MAAYSCESENGADTVVCEALELTLSEIEVARQRLIDQQRGCRITDDGTGSFEFFLKPMHMQSASNRSLQTHLRYLQRTVQSTSSLTFLLPWLLSVCGIEENNKCDAQNISHELKWRIQEATDHHAFPVKYTTALQDILWLLDAIQKAPDDHTQQIDWQNACCCLMENALYQWMMSATLTQITLPSVKHLGSMVHFPDIHFDGPAVIYQVQWTLSMSVTDGRSCR